MMAQARRDIGRSFNEECGKSGKELACLVYLSVLLTCGLAFVSTCRAQDQKLASTEAGLLARIARGDGSAVLELGALGDASVIPYLRTLIRPGAAIGGMSDNAEAALAKLGDREQMDSILKGLQDRSPSLQNNSVRKLSYIGGRESIRALIGLLDQDYCCPN